MEVNLNMEIPNFRFMYIQARYHKDVKPVLAGERWSDFAKIIGDDQPAREAAFEEVMLKHTREAGELLDQDSEAYADDLLENAHMFNKIMVAKYLKEQDLVKKAIERFEAFHRDHENIKSTQDLLSAMANSQTVW